MVQRLLIEPAPSPGATSDRRRCLTNLSPAPAGFFFAMAAAPLLALGRKKGDAEFSIAQS
jgi:hypothetical protein